MPDISSTQTISVPFARTNQDDIVTISELFEELVAPEKAAAIQQANDIQLSYLERVAGTEMADDDYAVGVREEIATSTEAITQRYLPDWEVRRDGDDLLQTSGHAVDVLPALQVDGASSVRMTVGGYGGSSLRLQLDRSGAKVVMTSTPALVKSFAPRVEKVIVGMKPRWGSWLPRSFFIPLTAAVLAVSALGMVLLGRDNIWWVVLVATVALSVLYWATTIPRLRIGPRVAPGWQRPLLWLLSHLFAAGLGVLFAYLFGPQR